MSWKLPLNQVGSGSSFVIGTQFRPTPFRKVAFHLDQHPWLTDILAELECKTEGDLANFSLQIDVEKQSDTYRVKASLQMLPELECVRSLTLFRSDISSDSEAIFVRAAQRKANGEHEISESEMESYEHDGASLLLSEFVTDLIYTSLPDFPLCQPECRGLCSDCGCNLNEARSCGNTRGERGGDSPCPNIQYFQ